jgi:hypothetical protein
MDGIENQDSGQAFGVATHHRCAFDPLFAPTSMDNQGIIVLHPL